MIKPQIEVTLIDTIIMKWHFCLMMKSTTQWLMLSDFLEYHSRLSPTNERRQFMLDLSKYAYSHRTLLLQE